ncbi:sugar transferase [Synechococcus sp. W4D4]|uniref:sugar transferase n=1 Tax=Synechococcus sp. W4D4 TaxID=3392294 RepID=UPI0039EB7DCE
MVALAAWDTLSIYTSYNLIYLLRIERWEGLSDGLITAIATWLSVSYLAGRYSPPSDNDRYPRTVQLAKTALAALAVIAVFVGHTWLYQVADAQTRFRGFLIPLVLSAYCLSTIGQAAQTTISTRRRYWLLLASEQEADVLLKEIAAEDYQLRSRTTVLTDGITTLDSLNEKSSCSIAVGKIDKSSDVERERILRFRERGEYVIPLLNWCEQELHRIPPEMVLTDWLIQAEGFALRPGSSSWRIKRFGDVIGALILILATAPLMLIAGILIWLEDRGPVFYRQTRSGLYGRKFKIWKLRSMSVNAERLGIQWASRGDPRVTRVGRLIRAARIDELPQLFSVLNGDLSLIGPRPERPEIEKELEKAIPNYRLRHWIRPGLSGWAQVCYPYGASIKDSRAKLSYDLYYLRNAGLALDFLITIKTMRLVSGAKGSLPLES